MEHPLDELLNFIRTASREEIRDFFGYYEPHNNVGPSILELIEWQETKEPDTIEKIKLTPLNKIIISQSPPIAGFVF